MKKYILPVLMLLTALILLPALLFAQTEQFVLKGKVGKLNAPSRMYISYKLNGELILDSVILKQGKFEFKGILTEPVLAKMLLDYEGSGKDKEGVPADMTALYLHKGTILLISKDSLKHAKVEGSALNKEYDRYQAFLSGPKSAMSVINQEYEDAPVEKQKDPVFMKGLEVRFRKAAEDTKVLQKTFVKNNPASYFSLIALEESSGRKLNLQEVEPLFTALTPALKDSRLGKEFAARIEAAKK